MTTLAQALNLFIAQHPKETTRHAYRVRVAPLCEYLGDGLHLSEVKPAQILAYYSQRLQPHGYAPATLRSHVISIKVFFNFCVDLELIDKSPARPLKTPKVARRISRDKAMTDWEYAALLEYFRQKEYLRDYALLLFLGDTGARIGGAATLRLRDLHLDELRATTVQKGGKVIEVVFSATCADAIRRWLQFRKAHYRVTGDLVFTRYGRPAKAVAVFSQQIARACKRLGLRTLGAHSLRHRKGHQCADHRIAPSLAATILGHENVTTTLEFYYPSDQASANAAARELMTAALPSASSITPFPGVKRHA